MTNLEDKIKKVPKKLCKALKSKLVAFRQRIPEKKHKAQDQSVYSRHFSQSVVSVKDCSQYHSFYVTKRTNRMVLTCQDKQDTAELLTTQTVHGVFLASNAIRSHKLFRLSNKDQYNNCPHQAIIHISPMHEKMNRTKSINSLDTCAAHLSMSCTKTIAKNIRSNRIEKCSKFIPVYDALNEKYPRGDISDRSLLNWLDVQAWYVNYLEEKLDEVDFLETKNSHKGLDDMELYRPSSRRRKQHLKIHEKSAMEDNRFGKNDQYLLTFTYDPEEDDSLPIQMYVKMTDASMNLCRLKSEMIVCCLQNFFKPYDNFDLMWVADLDGQISEIQSKKSLDIFKRDVVETVDLQNVNAIVYLPRIPATKLRHKDLCVLDTIAKTLGLKPHQVLFLPMDRKMYLW